MRKNGGRTSADIVKAGKRDIGPLDLVADDLGQIAETADRALSLYFQNHLNGEDKALIARIVVLARTAARRVRARARREARKGVAK